MKKVLAFDIGGTNTRLALVNENFEIEKQLINSTPTHDVGKFVDNIIKMIESFPLEDVVGIAAGVPGVVNKEKAEIIILPNVKVSNIPLGEILMKKFNLPLFLRNDAELACLGEAYLGAGKKYDRVFFITISTGLGGALCVDKKCQDYVTEVGHTLFNYKGTVQEYSIISGIEIKNFAKFHGMNVENAKELFEKVRAKDKDGLFLINEFTNIFDSYIKLVIDSYAPDIIVFTGGLMKAKDLYFNTLKRRNRGTKLVECKFKEQAGLIGSAVYALQCCKII